MPIPLMIPPREDPQVSPQSLRLLEGSTVHSRKTSGAFGPRAFAHLLDVLVVQGFSTYAAKLTSWFLVSFHMTEIGEAGKWAEKTFQETLSFGHWQVWAVTLLIFSFLYFVGMPLVFGRTLGLGLLGLKIETDEGERPGLGALALRFLGCLSTYMGAGIFLLLALRNRNGELFSDKLSHTRVVNIR